MRGLLVFAIIAVCGCASKREPKPGYYGGDGSSWRNPIVIVTRYDKREVGQWLQQHYPGCFVKGEFAPSSQVPSDLVIYRIRTQRERVIELWFKIVIVGPQPIVT
jgi:hypothetical protein